MILKNPKQPMNPGYMTDDVFRLHCKVWVKELLHIIC